MFMSANVLHLSISVFGISFMFISARCVR